MTLRECSLSLSLSLSLWFIVTIILCRASDEVLFGYSKSEPRAMRRQGSSLPSLLEATPAPSPHLTHSQQNLLSPPPPTSVRASRGSTIDFAEVVNPADLVYLDLELRNTLLCSDDMSELQISHV